MADKLTHTLVWSWWLRLWFVVGRDIKPPLGHSPFEPQPLVRRATYAVRMGWWKVHTLLDVQLGARRRALWDGGR